MDIPQNLFNSICAVVKMLNFDIALEDIRLRCKNRFGFLLNPEARDWFRSSSRLRKLIFLFEALITEQEHQNARSNKPSLLLFTAGGSKIVSNYAQGQNNLLALHRETIMSAIADEVQGRFAAKVEIAVAEKRSVELHVEAEVQECYDEFLNELGDQLVLVYNIQRSRQLIDAIIAPAEFDIALELIRRSVLFLREPGEYFSFEELYFSAARRGVLVFNSGEEQKSKQGVCDLQFQRWLEKEKGLAFGDIKQYRAFITNEVFLEFLLSQQIDIIKESENDGRGTTEAEPIVNSQSGQTRLTLSSCALKHVFLAMFKGQPVTHQNKNALARKYGHNSGDKLINEFTRLKNAEVRLDLNTTSKKSALAHLSRYESIFPVLREENPDAYEQARKEYLQLERTYYHHFNRP